MSSLSKKYVMLLAVVLLVGMHGHATASEQSPEERPHVGLVERGAYALYRGASAVVRAGKAVGGTVFGLGCASATPVLLAMEHYSDPRGYESFPLDIWPVRFMGEEVRSLDHMRVLNHQIKTFRFIAIPLSALGAYVLYRTWREDAPQKCDFCASTAEPIN